MTESGGQEQSRWITTVIMSTALQVQYHLSRAAYDSLRNTERSVFYILYVEIFYAMSMNIGFLRIKQWHYSEVVSTIVLVLFVCVCVFSPSYFCTYLVFLPLAILSYTALGLSS